MYLSKTVSVLICGIPDIIASLAHLNESSVMTSGEARHQRSLLAE